MQLSLGTLFFSPCFYMYWLLACLSLDIAGSSADDITALLAFQATVRGSHSALASWKANVDGSFTPCNGWTGVGCDTLGNVVNLNLWFNELTGEIPVSLGNCKSLQSMEISDNQLTGTIPKELGQLQSLWALYMTGNKLEGSIPPEIGNCSSLADLQLDRNQLSGTIPPELGSLTQLSNLLLWENQLTGPLPASLGNCNKLANIDVSGNSLNGSIPPALFLLPMLEKLTLGSNQFSGEIPTNIDQSTGLLRLRLSNNSLSGSIPPQVGLLKNLVFLDIAFNNLSGSIPSEIGNASALQLLTLNANHLTGTLPVSLGNLARLQTLDVSDNGLEGPLPQELGNLGELLQLSLSDNAFMGPMPVSLGNCQQLELLNMSQNHLNGSIIHEIGKLTSLISGLDLSCNNFTGPLPEELANLVSLQLLDLSQNSLTGSLQVLGQLDSLTSLNVSFNDFTGPLPDSSVFRNLPSSDVVGNPGLCLPGRNSANGSSCDSGSSGQPSTDDQGSSNRHSRSKAGITTMVCLLFGFAILILAGGCFLFYKRYWIYGRNPFGSEAESTWPWKLTPFQKLTFTVDDVLDSLVELNIIGSGFSGIVYKAEMDGGETIAVKKLWPATVGERNYDAFAAEVDTLGRIRHRNIVRLLGYCSNKELNLLMYDYLPNGSLGEVLHEKRKNLNWETRYNICLGAAQGLAYLHHDCVPAILHRDVKSNNILLDSRYEPFVADFGLAKLIDGANSKAMSKVAGSYGYIAPEYGYTLKITEKSDVYSYGVVLLEVLTGRRAVDSRYGEGWHIVKWVQDMNMNPQVIAMDVLDSRLCGMPDDYIQEMLQTLGVALMCVNQTPAERPTMKEVVTLLLEVGACLSL
ncbi:unnamed protein product [Sphagnum balticum]